MVAPPGAIGADVSLLPHPQLLILLLQSSATKNFEIDSRITVGIKARFELKQDIP